jgi:hypothetical protein
MGTVLPGRECADSRSLLKDADLNLIIWLEDLSGLAISGQNR